MSTARPIILTRWINSRTVRAAAACALLGLAIVPISASAAVIPIGPSFTTTDGGDHVLSLSVPTTASSDAVLALSFTGDYNGYTENATITLDGLGLGTVFNEIGADDRFAYDFDGTDDVPRNPNGFADWNDTDFNFLYTSSATITLAELLPIIADGQLLLTIDNSEGVTALGVFNFPTSFNPPPEASSFVQGTLTFTEAVPVPAGIWLLLSGLIALAGISSHRTRS